LSTLVAPEYEMYSQMLGYPTMRHILLIFEQKEMIEPVYNLTAINCI